MADTSIQNLISEAEGSVLHLSEVVSLLDATSAPVRWQAPESVSPPEADEHRGCSPLAGRLQSLIQGIDRQRNRVNTIIGTFEVDGSQDIAVEASDPNSAKAATAYLSTAI